MKEPTIEQKAKRYDEVLAMAKECITYIPDEAVNKYMLNMFPELQEIEQERIRKAIIELIKQSSEVLSKQNQKQMLAWLEKQSEQKPTDEEMKEILRTEYEKGRADAIAETQVAWSEEDERIRNCLIKDQEEALTDVKNDRYGHSEIISDLKEMYNERISWLKDLKQRITNKQ